VKIKEHTQELVWRDGIGEIWQKSERAHAYTYYYVYRVGVNWYAGRYWFSQEIDFRLQFSSAKVARDYCALHDRESVVIVAS